MAITTLLPEKRENQRKSEVRHPVLLVHSSSVGIQARLAGGDRLTEFARLFAADLVRQEQRDHARTYLVGLVSDLKRKNTERSPTVATKYGTAFSTSSAPRPGTFAP